MAALSVLLASALLVSTLCGCGGDAAGRYELWSPVRDLTAAAGGGAMGTEPSDVSMDTSPAEAARALMDALLAGPRDPDLRSPFPEGTSLRSLEIQGSRALVDLSGGYASLSGISLTLADCSIVLTLGQIPEVSVVRITVEGQPLAYRDRQSFTVRDVVLAPEGDVVGTVDALLYFPDADGGLTAEPRSLPLYEGDTQAGTVATALEAGPVRRDLSPALPEGLRPKAVWQEDGLCFVDMPSDLPDGLPDPQILSPALWALDLSLCSLENVRAVRYLVDGEYVEQYGGVRLREPYEILDGAGVPSRDSAGRAGISSTAPSRSRS